MTGLSNTPTTTPEMTFLPGSAGGVVLDNTRIDCDWLGLLGSENEIMAFVLGNIHTPG